MAMQGKEGFKTIDEIRKQTRMENAMRNVNNRSSIRAHTELFKTPSIFIHHTRTLLHCRSEIRGIQQQTRLSLQSDHPQRISKTSARDAA